MLKINLISLTLFSSTVVTAMLLISAPVQACSDLPNICEQQRQHWESLNDTGAAIEAINRAEAEAEEWQAPPPYYDPMQARLDVAVGTLQLFANSVDKKEQLSKDPRFQRYNNGGWDFFQDKVDAAPGEYCAAFFWKKDGFVRVSGPGGDYQGALLTFWGENIPRPKKVEKIKVTLTQSNEPPQTVQAFNYIMSGDAYGAIALAVPSIEAALAGMEDVQSFDLAIEGKSVAKVEWNGGLAARDQLSKCVSLRVKK